ncbi:Asp23/Gls24 family envelope stress response protein [Kribbella sindirgiensis]|uniref:Asp23/Gls24 family envelope stress response protein n=2 Tax=Kribbella sindirgiensis TaxID=1124744 RepID=A0A4V2M3M2_9ACTN|nr:Asp23/Gls24 family envelope stress response protein [Kribbella sindirgiensis]
MTPGNPVTDLHPLACGRTVEDVWDDLDSGRTTAHLKDCPHCRTARASLGQLADATAFLIDDPAEVPAGLLDRVMSAVRADLSLGRTLALPTGAAQVDLSVSALAAVLRYAVDGVAGIRARHCRIELVTDQPDTLTVSMTVALRYGSGRVAALELARERVVSAVRAQAGFEVAELDFEIVDVWTDQQ